MSKLCLILKDQLAESISSLTDFDSKEDVVLICEIWNEFTYVKHHKKKIAFLLSAMRHFAQYLIQKGYQVEYIKLDDYNHSLTLLDAVQLILIKRNIEKIVVTYPSEYNIFRDIKQWKHKLSIPIEIRSDDRFLCSVEEFAEWSKDRKQLRMEYFYREMRKKYNLLMQDNKPIGEKWNYDAQNRKPPKEDLCIPDTYAEHIDNLTQDVINLVAKHFNNNFGDLKPLHFAVTRDGALRALQLFIEQRLQYFGDYQDAMLENEPWMYHSHISLYINCGLLLPLECVKAAELAYMQKKATLPTVEGFIRQIIGWREYIRGIYWLKMPEYACENLFLANRKLPDFYWTAKTKMNCIKQCVLDTKKHAYAHHIQRLMVLGNFALLTGIDPKYVNEWFLIVYADAYEWVELPNVSGMALFADGGYLASKPYASGGKYINKMSNYCKNCSYQVTKKYDNNACPFNYLYWDFLVRNRDKLQTNHRIAMMYKIYDKMTEEQHITISNQSFQFLLKLDNDGTDW